MKREAIDDAFFQGDALLLVEDHRTRLVLSECWSSSAVRPTIVVRAVGGGEAVRSLVQSAREIGRHRVFGLRDVDFGAFRPLAEQPGPVWSTPGHEVENLLLDFDALALLAVGVTADEIATQARRRAEALVPWMATCGVLRELRSTHPSVPSHPAVASVHDRLTALEHLRAPGYVDALRRSVVTPWTDRHIETLLDQKLSDYGREMANGDWTRTFSGKEIFEHLHGGAGIPWRNSRASADDLAVGIARGWGRAGAPEFVDGLRARIVAAVPPRR